jgi:transmembrane sensor
VNRQIVQEASEWFVELNADNPDGEIRRQFDNWLRASPEHMRAFIELLPIWQDGTQLPVGAGTTPEQLIAWARASENVIPIRPAAAAASSEAERSLDSRPSRWRPVQFALAASLLVALTCATVFWRYQALRSPTYVAGIGEQRSLVLPDGSTVELNTLSKIRIRYAQDERAVELLQGQALFRVAKNVERPFVVYSGDVRVRAVGTRFDVYRKATGTIVTVVEGRVAVSLVTDRGSGALARGDTVLNAGDQLTLVAGAPQPADRALVEHPSMASATAWTQRQLVFDSASLQDVAAEFNRYNTRRMTVDASRLTDFRISGIFSSSDPSSLIRFLREQPRVQVAETNGEIRVWRD